MKTQQIGTSDLVCSRLAYGCMRTVGTWNPAEVDAARRATAMAALDAALDAGYTLFDHADIYCRGMCETVFGEWLAQEPRLRDRIVIATKCGIRFPGDPNPDSPHRFDFSSEHIIRSCEASLKRLRIETIDLYQLHRPDFLMDPHDVAHAFSILRKQGKVRWCGVSNFPPHRADTLAQWVGLPLVVNQVQVHLGFLDTFEDGTLDQCMQRRWTPLAWSPLGGGFLGQGGSVSPNHPRHDDMVKLTSALDDIARAKGVSRTVISLAWLLKHPSGIMPIVGSAKPANIRDAVLADSCELSREEWYRLFVAARGKKLP